MNFTDAARPLSRIYEFHGCSSPAKLYISLREPKFGLRIEYSSFYLSTGKEQCNTKVSFSVKQSNSINIRNKGGSQISILNLHFTSPRFHPERALMTQHIVTISACSEPSAGWNAHLKYYYWIHVISSIGKHGWKSHKRSRQLPSGGPTLTCSGIIYLAKFPLLKSFLNKMGMETIQKRK